MANGSALIPELKRNRRGGPRTPEGKAKALANLRPPWTAETAPASPGRPVAGASVRNKYNEMQDWTLQELQTYIDAPNSPANGVTAAMQWKLAREGRGDSVDRITTNTAGPVGQDVNVNVQHEHRHTVDFDAIENELAAIVTRNRGRVAKALTRND